MELTSKILLLLLILPILSYSTYNCIEKSSSSYSNSGPIFVPIGFEDVKQDGLTCEEMFSYLGDPDNTFYSGDWYLFYYHYTGTTPDDYRFGYQNPYAYTGSYHMISNFSQINLYYLLYNSIYDISNGTTNIPIYSKMYDYENTNRGVNSLTFTADVNYYLVNSTLCGEGKCNLFKYEGASSLSYSGAITNSISSSVSNHMRKSMRLNTSDTVIFDSTADPQFENPFGMNYKAITPTYLDNLVYILNAPSIKQYGIFVDYNGTRYLITAGLDGSESFYTDTSLRHYIKCNLTDENSSLREIYLQASGIMYYIDANAFCSEASTEDMNLTIDLDTLGCGEYSINKTGDNEFNVTINSNATMEIRYLLTNDTWQSIITTGNVSYLLTNTTGVHLYCDSLVGYREVATSFSKGGNLISSSKAVTIIVLFAVFLGVMFMSSNFIYSLILAFIIIFSLTALGVIAVDVSFLVSMLVMGAVAYWLVNTQLGGKK